MHSQFYVGIVENRDDPLKLGRVQVRVFGVHSENLNDVPTSSLPWAVSLMPATSASLSGIGYSAVGYVEGSMVFVFFQDGESLQNPIIMGSAHGVPVAKSSFVLNSTVEKIEDTTNISTKERVVSTVSPSAPTTLLDTSGKAVAGVSSVSSTPSDGKDSLKAALGKRESSNNYKAINQLGYIGKYQMGAAMLTDLGYVKKGTKNRDLTDPDVWTGKNGVSSRDDFLNNSSEQETAMDAELVMNEKRLTRMGVIDENSTLQEKNGYLATAHLLGTGGARDMKRGVVKTDANGVSGNEYYKLGYKSAAGENPTISPENVVIENPNRVPSVDSTTGNVAKQTTKPTYGFADPNGVYPSYTKEQDTNRLARVQNISKTIVALKESTLDKGVSIANSSDTWTQSPVPYNAKYPFNHVHESESGHVFEVDDTPGNERIHQFHTSGTFTEIDRNGTVVNKIVGDSFEIVERNGYVHIKGSVNITVDGNAAIHVNNNCELEVNGDLNSNIGGNVNWSVAGDFNVKVGGKESHSIGGDFAVDSSNVWLNSGEAAAGGLPTVKGASGVPTFAPLSVGVRGFEALSEFETDDNSQEEIEANNTALQEAGLLDVNPEPPVVSEPEQVKQDPVDDKIVECGMFTTGDVNINEFISNNYKLKDLTKGAKIVDQCGLTDAQIACNLKALAENILEPIKQLYPDVIITSGLRPMGSNSKSQHPLGMAVDIQFTTKVSADYLAIAKQLGALLNYDQLILEYRSDKRVNGAPTTWLHISYTTNGNRRNIFTMNNDKRISNFGELKEVK